MKFPETPEALNAAADEARKSFFREYGDSANALIVDRALFDKIPGHESALSPDADGGRRLRNLKVVFASIPGHPFCAAIVHDPFYECSACGSL
jgi:hypothetical protein